MLTKLILKNFQAHKKRTIVFDKGITSVVGDSDVGKSAIVRALGWVATNKPNGDSFIRHGADDAIVTLEIDGHVIVRSRGKDGNKYELDGKEYKAFGNGVPREIEEILRIGATNLQRQHDAPFWFSESAGVVSKELNNVINLSVIDEVLSDISSQVRKHRASVEFCTERLEKARARRDELKPIVEIDERLTEIEAQAVSLRKIQTQASDLSDLMARLRQCRDVKKRTQETAQNGTLLLSAAVKYRDIRKKRFLLNGSLQDLAAMEQLAKIKLPDLSKIQALKKTYDAVSQKRQRIEACIEHLRFLWKEQKRTRIEHAQAHKEFHKRTHGEHCPLCKKPL